MTKMVWVIAALIAVQVLFGVNYVISKAIVSVFPPLLWASARATISAGILMMIATAMNRPPPMDRDNFFKPLILFSLLGIIVNQGSFLVGLHYTTSTNSAILNTMIPVFTLLVVTIRGQEPFTALRAIGFLFAFSGVLIIRKVEEFTLSNHTLIGDLLTLLNCLSYSLFLSYGRGFLQRHDPIWTTGWLFAYGSVGLTALSLPDWVDFRLPDLSPVLFGCIAFSLIGGTLLTYFLNLWALSKVSSSSVALFIYLQPIVASVFAWAWSGEVITSRAILASFLIFVGMLIAISEKIRKSSPSSS